MKVEEYYKKYFEIIDERQCFLHNYCLATLKDEVFNPFKLSVLSVVVNESELEREKFHCFKILPQELNRGRNSGERVVIVPVFSKREGVGFHFQQLINYVKSKNLLYELEDKFKIEEIKKSEIDWIYNLLPDICLN